VFSRYFQCYQKVSDFHLQPVYSYSYNFNITVSQSILIRYTTTPKTPLSIECYIIQQNARSHQQHNTQQLSWYFHPLKTQVMCQTWNSNYLNILIKNVSSSTAGSCCWYLDINIHSLLKHFFPLLYQHLRISYYLHKNVGFGTASSLEYLLNDKC
jgi:hypothetical protein